MATISAVSTAPDGDGDGGGGSGSGSGSVGYPTFDDAPFVNKPILILDGGTENYPIQNKWIRCVCVCVCVCSRSNVGRRT